MAEPVARPVRVDTRNLLDPAVTGLAGFDHHGLGARPARYLRSQVPHKHFVLSVDFVRYMCTVLAPGSYSPIAGR